MELLYCEQCGDIIREPEKLEDVRSGIVCAACRGGERSTESSSNQSTGSFFGQQKLELFSEGSIAIRKEEMLKKESVYKQPEARERKRSHRLMLAKTTGEDGEGCTAPSRSAQKILFRCLHCRSPLAIRPVHKQSRLLCPHCEKPIIVTSEGRLAKASFRTTKSPSSDARAPSPSAPPVASSEPAPTEIPLADASTRSQQPRRAPSSAPGAGPGKKGSVRKPASKASRRPDPKPQASSKTQESSKKVSGKPTAVPAARVGFRSDAHEPRQARTGKPDPAASPPAAKKAPRGRSAGDAGPESIDKASPWKSMAPSAFEEHMRSKDPEKTFFLTEQRPSKSTGSDLADVVSKELEDLESTLGEVEGDSQFPDDDLQVRDASFKRSFVDRPTTLNALSAFCVALVLLLPFVAVCGLWVGQASAQSAQVQSETATPHTYMEHLGATAHQGIQALMSHVGLVGE